MITGIVDRFLDLSMSQRREIGLSLGLITEAEVRATTANERERNTLIFLRAKEQDKLGDVDAAIAVFEQ